MLHVNFDGFTTTKSLDLAGGDYVNLGNVLGTQASGTAPWTFEGWFEFDNLNPGGGGLSVLMNKRQTSPSPGILIYIVTAGGLYLLAEGTGGVSDRLWARTVTGAIGTGSWTHIAVTYDGSQSTSGTTFYINGSAATKDTDLSDTLSTSTSNTRSVYIGSRETFGNSYVDGRIHRVSIWNKVLTSAEVSQAYGITNSAGLLSHSASGNLVAYWRMGNDPMDDATGGTGVIKDRVGGLDGTPVGTVAGNIVTDAP